MIDERGETENIIEFCKRHVLVGGSIACIISGLKILLKALV